jgi:hypothetical protein
MLQPAIDIPRPLSADTETVATALETAELFRARGDTLEAVRWLRRAAESAGEAGDDERALALSRTAADLHDALDAKPAPASVTRLSAAPASVPRPSAPSSAPPPTSARSATPPPLPSSHQPPSVVTSAPPVVTSAPPVVTSAPPVTPSAPPVTPSALPVAPSTPQVTPRPSYPPPPSSRPGFHASPSRPPVAPSTPTTTSSARNATRVAINRSPTQPGVFEMRLLADGESAPASGSEGYLVMIDPTSTLLSS